MTDEKPVPSNKAVHDIENRALKTEAQSHQRDGLEVVAGSLTHEGIKLEAFTCRNGAKLHDPRKADLIECPVGTIEDVLNGYAENYAEDDTMPEGEETEEENIPEGEEGAGGKRKTKKKK